MKFAVIQTGGKQYLVKENDELYVDRLKAAVNEKIAFDLLASGDLEKNEIELGQPLLASKAEGTILGNLKGDKIKILRFKAKTRYRRMKGFRPYLTKIKITKL